MVSCIKQREVYVMIGNGFDIECGLPTTYSDFLNFLSAIVCIKNSPAAALDTFKLHPEVERLLKLSFMLNRNYASNWESVVDNYWYEHFKIAQLKLGWVDFENELSRVIRIIERSLELVRHHFGTLDDNICCYDQAELYDVIGDILHNAGINQAIRLPDGSYYTAYNILYRDLRDKLLRDLNSFIWGFETYLREYVGKIPVKPTDNIALLMELMLGSRTRYVLSFNYTTTFEKLLNAAGIEAEFCYVHGKIGDGTGKNRMVLGMDEYLSHDAIKHVIGFAPFRKYNQRIFKQTDSNYFDWLDKIEADESINRRLYIFGHSIGITDKDIISSFIQAARVHTTLFYHNEEAFSNQVSNLTAIIGMDEMIFRTSGKHNQMEFIKQL